MRQETKTVSISHILDKTKRIMNGRTNNRSKKIKIKIKNCKRSGNLKRRKKSKYV